MKEGWEYKKLGDIGTFIRGGNFSKKDFVEDGFPCIHYGQIHMKFGVETLRSISSVPAEMVKNDRCAKKGDLVIAITSEDDAGSCKCTAWMGDYDVYVGGHTAIYRHTMQPKYVSYYFMSPYLEISPKDIAKISIPVPPLSEQQSIVDYLDSAFAKIDAMKANAEKRLNEAKALFQASLKEMLEPKEGWGKKQVKDMSLLITKGSSPKWQGNSYVNSDGILFVTSENVREGYLEFNPAKYVDNSFNIKQRRSILNKGDVLVNIVGASIGRAAIFDLDVENANINQAVCLIRLDKNNMLPPYLCFFLNSEHAFIQYASMVKDTARANLSLENVGCLEIGIPSLSEQQSIVTTLDNIKSKVDRLQANYEKISQECDALKQAILRQVFE